MREKNRNKENPNGIKKALPIVLSFVLFFKNKSKTGIKK
jgi:hypothetical protein